MKKLMLFWFCSLILFLTIQAQPRNDSATVAQIKAEAYQHSQVMQTLFNLTDVYGPRLSGSQNLRNAQEWSMKQLRDWGMENVNLESWGSFGKGWEVQKSYVAITHPYYQPLIAIPKAWTPGTNGLISANVVLVRVDKEEDFEKYKGKLEGKIIVLAANLEVKPRFKPDARRYSDEDLRNIAKIRNPEANPENRPPRDTVQMRKMRQLRVKLNKFIMDEKAAAVLSSRGGTMGTFFTTNGASYATNAKAVLPELEMGSESINQIMRLLDAGKDVRVEMEIQTLFTDKDTMQYNVIAEIPGTDKKLKSELVMLGAHIDSWHAATGATDNAAGSAVMMEALRIIKASELKPRRTIRLALWSAEEQGLLGSRGYVRKHFAHPDSMNLKPEHAKLSAYYNLDNGGGKIRGIYLQGNDTLQPLFEEWFRNFDDEDAVTITTRNTGSTDHIAFDNVGLPGFQFIQDPMDYGNKTHHTNMDTYDRIVGNDLMQASAIIAYIVYKTAMKNEKISRKALPKAKIGN